MPASLGFPETLGAAAIREARRWCPASPAGLGRRRTPQTLPPLPHAPVTPDDCSSAASDPQDDDWDRVRVLESLVHPDHSADTLREALLRLVPLAESMSDRAGGGSAFTQDPKVRRLMRVVSSVATSADAVVRLRCCRIGLVCGDASDLAACSSVLYGVSKSRENDGLAVYEGTLPCLLRLASAPALPQGASAMACAALRNSAADPATAHALVREGGVAVLSRLAAESLELAARAQPDDDPPAAALDTALQAAGALMHIARYPRHARALLADGAVPAVHPAPFRPPLPARQKLRRRRLAAVAPRHRNQLRGVS
eukprot:TRINITY_DN306_c5_g1_i4.p2 TRINITY_DN306_c5_g1~~TRINITY_DN306_c5_g1_i4.p2  ORF type:complete len:331 (+),score=98.80 TRINITY_DN306_c5_g1_i4:57-995(+)